LTFLKEKHTLTLREDTTTPKGRRARTAAVRAGLADLGDIDKNLFDALRHYRMELAKEQNVPPYVIFHDKTLLEMAARKPQTLEEFATISGVGESKMNRYGQSFL